MRKIGHRLTAEKVREVCIKRNLYTMGDCMAYEKMLSKCTSYGVTDDKTFFEIVEDIAEHTDPQATDYLAYVCNQDEDGSILRVEIEGMLLDILENVIIRG